MGLVSGSVRHFDQFRDFRGGGFHSAGNEVSIILHMSYKIENVACRK